MSGTEICHGGEEYDDPGETRQQATMPPHPPGQGQTR